MNDTTAENAICRLCGKPIQATEKFFRDDETPGWCHRECVFQEAREAWEREEKARSNRDG
jgi:hypothetical protein